MKSYSIPDMSCGHCKAAIEKAVTTADAGAYIEFDLENRTAQFDTVLDEAALLAALKDAGYDAQPRA